MDGDFDNVTDERVYVGPKCNKLKPRFNPMIEFEKENMLLVRSWADNEGSNPSDLKVYGRPGVIWVGFKARNGPTVFGLCTHPDVRDYRGQTRVCTRLSGKKTRIS